MFLSWVMLMTRVIVLYQSFLWLWWLDINHTYCNLIKPVMQWLNHIVDKMDLPQRYKYVIIICGWIYDVKSLTGVVCSGQYFHNKKLTTCSRIIWLCTEKQGCKEKAKLWTELLICGSCGGLHLGLKFNIKALYTPSSRTRHAKTSSLGGPKLKHNWGP